MPACTPDRGNRTPTLSPPSCDLTTLTGAKLATMPAPRPLATKRRVTPFLLACVLRLMRFLLGVRVFASVRPSIRCLLAVRHAAGATCRGRIFRTRGEGGRGGTWGARARSAGVEVGIGSTAQQPLGAVPAAARGAVLPGVDQGQRWCGGGAEGVRAPDLVNAIHALSQLSYGPSMMGNRHTASAAGPPKYSAAGFRASGCRPQRGGANAAVRCRRRSRPLLRLVGLRHRA